jgi:hypothetical protein
LDKNGASYNPSTKTNLIEYEEWSAAQDEDSYNGKGGYLFNGVNLPGLQKKVEDDINDMTYQKDATKSDSFAG